MTMLCTLYMKTFHEIILEMNLKVDMTNQHSTTILFLFTSSSSYEPLNLEMVTGAPKTRGTHKNR